MATRARRVTSRLVFVALRHVLAVLLLGVGDGAADVLIYEMLQGAVQLQQVGESDVLGSGQLVWDR